MASTPICSEDRNLHESRKHYITPQKAALKKAFDLLGSKIVYEPNGKRLSKRQLCRDEGIPKGSISRIINSLDSRRHHNVDSDNDKRDAKCILSERDLRQAKMLL